MVYFIMIKTKAIWNPLKTGLPAQQKVPYAKYGLAISLGYFVYDTQDMYLNCYDQFSILLVLHHIASISLISWTLCQEYYRLIVCLGLLFEGHSAFYHIRNLIYLIPETYNISWAQRNFNNNVWNIILIFNYIAYIIFRIGVQIYIQYLLFKFRKSMAEKKEFKTGFYVLNVIVVGFWVINLNTLRLMMNDDFGG